MSDTDVPEELLAAAAEDERQQLEHREAENAKGSSIQDKGLGEIVAAHYNNVQEVGLEQRSRTRIFYMRNFNNWIKSMLIRKHLKVRDAVVLDLGCGKGGDMLKWEKGNIKHLVCVDIADVSVEQCRTRHESMVQNRSKKVFTCQFITADCTKVRLREKYTDPTIKFDLVSCQFAFHYCFESLPQAETMLKNVGECLRTGGKFIGTLPNASEIVRRLRKNNSNLIDNSIYKIEMSCSEPYPLFGAKYNFYLDGVVDCPEFLVHMPTLKKLAAKFGLRFVNSWTFPEFFNECKQEGEFLIDKMKALEIYPPFAGYDQQAGDDGDYQHLKGKSIGRRVRTLTISEWEVISLYLVFVFEKVETFWDKDGNPEYKI